MAKAQKTTRIVICLQNRVHEMIAAKLEQAMKKVDAKRAKHASLKEDLKDVTQHHNERLVKLRETFEKEKIDETAAILARCDQQIKEVETKIRGEQTL